MSPARARTILLLAGLMAGPAGHAQDARTAYRCADGQYSQAPCPGGRQLNLDPAPSAAQQAQARESAAAQSRLAEQLRAERHARERAAQGQAPARIGPPKPTEDARAARAASRGMDDGQAKPKKPRRNQQAHHHDRAKPDEPRSRKAFAPQPTQ